MRLTAMGKLILLILVVGAALGGYRAMSGKGGIKLPGIGGTKGGTSGGESGTNGSGQSGTSESGESAGTSEGNTAGGVEIPFIITAAKKGWVADQVVRFNAQNAGKWRIVTSELPSREAMHAILGGKEKPVLWSPGSPIWPARLAQAWRQKHSNAILDLNDPTGYRVYLRTPLVFMTTRDKAKFLRPLLSGPNGWQNLRRLSMGQLKTPFGPLSWSHADPLTSSSGMLTLGLVLFDYSGRSGQGGDLTRLAQNPAFLSYVSELERSLTYDSPAEKGTTALTKAFLENMERYDIITGYESAALEAAPKLPNLAVIYPNPTADSEHAVSLLNGDWVSPAQKQGAEAFMTFLGSPQALQDGLKYKFRPAQSGGTLTLAPELSRFASQGFQQSYAPIQLPPYEALNTAAYQWRIKIAHQPA